MTDVMQRLSAALADRYRIERELGQGGMATVYLAQDLKHDRRVALKVLKPELAAVLGAERFVVEIKTTAALQHPHILPLFDSGTADGFLFYVMPFIDGETLRSKLDRETQFGVDEAVRIAAAVADALDYAHRHGVIHRDIKPENILLHEGRPMVADFGIALAVSAAAGGRMTETGLSLGTPHYMSPEQATAEKEISARSDVYSLASVLYEMLAGQPPHLGGSAQQIIMKIITETAPSVTTLRKSVPLHVAAAVAKALEKLPADRFESAKAFGDALGNTGFAHVSGATSLGGAPRAAARLSRRAYIAALVIAVPTLVVAFWSVLKPASPSITRRDEIVLWAAQRPNGVTVGRGLALSPDGGAVVFVDSTKLFLKEQNQLDAAALPGTNGAVGAPVFSPDGALIAFIDADGKVRKIPRLGGAAITIADSANTLWPSLAWLDGGTILYGNASNGLSAVSQDGGASRVVLNFPVSDSAARLVRGVFGFPGHKVALVTTCPAGCATSDLRVLDLRSATPKVTVLTEEVLAGWLLPGGNVAFVRRDGGVFGAPFDVSTLAFVRSPTPLLDGVFTSINTADMLVSANGTAIYQAGRGEANPMQLVAPVWVTRAGAATSIDTAWTMRAPPYGFGSLGRRLALSPDGRRLAVAIPRGNGAASDIWIKQLYSAPFTLTKLTFEGDNQNPVWTRDGAALVYTSGATQRPGLIRRRRANATGFTDTLVTLPRAINDVVLTPDTTQFVLRVVAPPSRDIARWRRGDSTATPLLATTKFSEIGPALSPDGRWLAYASDESGRYEVYVSPYPDVTAGRWQVSQAGGVAPTWSRNGRELFYQNEARGLVAATVLPGMTFTLGAQVVLFNASGFAGANGTLYFDVAPDGQRFVMLRSADAPGSQGAPRLVRITNWGGEVQTKLKDAAP